MAIPDIYRSRKATQTDKTYNTQTRQTGHTVHRTDIQWNLSNLDTLGAEGSVLISEVS